MSPRIKDILCLKKKRNVSLNQKVIFVFHTIFKLNFMTQIIYCIYPQKSVFCFHTKKRNVETILTVPYSYSWQKFNNKMNEKRSQKYQSMDPECVTMQINSLILELFLDDFAL